MLSATGEYRFLGRFELEKMGGSFNGWAIDDVAERIACASSVGGVALFASTTKEKVWQMTSKELGTSGVRSVAFSPDGQRVYASTTEGLLYCLDAKDGDILSKGVLARQGMLWSGKTPLERLRVSPDGRHVVGFSTASQTWIVWDFSAEQVVHSQRAPAGPGYPMNGLMITVFFGQDGAIGYVGIDGPKVFYKPSYPISNK